MNFGRPLHETDVLNDIWKHLIQKEYETKVS